MDHIWIRDSNGKGAPHRAPTSPISETELQRIIIEQPEILDLPATREMAVLGEDLELGESTPDILGVDAAGRPVIVEVKVPREGSGNIGIVARCLAIAADLQTRRFPR